MYQNFFGLHSLPFELTADPAFLFLGSTQREVLSNLEYGLFAAKSLTVLTGEPGTGKTTLLRAALESERCRHVISVSISNPALTRDEFVATLASAFNIKLETGSKAALLEALDRELRARRSRGIVTALVIDEAQALSTELLEEIRLLGNLESTHEKLLPLVLAGQTEFAVRLESPALRQLKQRIALRCETLPLTLQETAEYIAGRIVKAGGRPAALFTQEAVAMIHRSSGGIARTIGVICDNALVTGMALERKPVDRAIVAEVCRDFCLPSGDPDFRAPAAPVAENTHAAKSTSTAPDADRASTMASGAAPRAWAHERQLREGRS